ncbi:MAG TPA: hypothetical protein VD813_06430 [Pseudonocardia sp.]|nr:hypothetical protein [Pseudonocardia sp.]
MAVFAVVQFRREGFRLRTEARCDSDGMRAVLLLTNVGRTSGAVYQLLVGRRRRAGRWGGEPIRLGYQPELVADKPMPWLLEPGVTVQVTMTADKDRVLFTAPSARIVVFTGRRVERIRIQTLQSGRLPEPATRQGDSGTEPRPGGTAEDTAGARPTEGRESVELAVDELVALHRKGTISTLDLWVGSYWALRRRQIAASRSGPADAEAGE